MLLWALLCAAPVTAQTSPTQARFRYSAAPLARVVADVEARTPYRFLYRDALLDGKTVTLDAPLSTLAAALAQVLEGQGVGVEADDTHRQILLFALSDRTARVSGYVLDAETGARLPYATVTYRDSGGQLRGAVCNEAGVFTLSLPPGTTADLTASFVGFLPGRARAVPGAGPLAFRLHPQRLHVGETTITGSFLQTDLDTAFAHTLSAHAAVGLSERSTLRALQVLPSVGIGPAFAPGPNVRGARADGFEVLLDGVPIYAPTHFFGLFEAFNPDALQAVAFYYDAAPAAFFAPPGGTLAYSTRTGSQRQPQFSAGLTNTSVRGTAEVPLASGRGSLLVGGRGSALGAFGWMGNGDLVRMGLDVERPTSALPPAAQSFDSFVVSPGAASATFYDAHAKLYGESEGGRRLMASLYAGGDATRQDARRFRAVSVTNPQQPRLEAEPVTTRNRWQSRSASVQLQGTWGAAYLSTVAAASHYDARFEKDDFLFERNPGPLQSLLRGPVDTLGYRNAFRELRLSQHAAWPAGARTVTAGYSLHHFAARYEEQSGRRLRYDQTRRATQADVFGEMAWQTSGLDARAGLRAHAFSSGPFLRLSPRVRVQFTPQQPLSLALSYSRNHQFLHSLYLENLPSARVWVLSTADEKPSQADGGSATLAWRPGSTISLQVDAYTRRIRHLRQHETNSAVRPAAREATLTHPWLTNLTARARGVEVLALATAGRMQWTNAYTLSRTRLQHPDLNAGQPFRADWDRLHQYRSHVSLQLARGVSADALWLYGTGTPNRLAYEDAAEPEALAAYHRLDLALRWAVPIRGRARVEAAFALYNAYNRANPWYRETVSVVETRAQRRRFGYYNVDVYDLGRTPSFEVVVRW